MVKTFEYRPVPKPKFKKKEKKSKDFPDKVRKQVKERSGGVCEHCCKKVAVHVHHVWGKGRGGYGVLTNAIDLCIDCHTIIHGSKGTEMMKHYIEKYTRLYGEKFYE